MINVEHNKHYSPGLLLLSTFWTLVFGYFALRLDDDPEFCEASDENDNRFVLGVSKHEPRYIDVGFRFRLVFQLAFFSNLSITVIGSMTYVVTSDVIRKLMFLALALMNYAVVFSWVFAFYVRL